MCTLSPELAAVVGQDTMARHEVVKKVWSIIKEQNLYVSDEITRCGVGGRMYILMEKL